MKKATWKKRIEEQMKLAGTYREHFVPVIDALAAILEERDRTREAFIAGGSEPLVEVVSDRGAVNMRKNPLLELWIALNKDALTYWRDLGLTPAGLKKIDETAMAPRKRSALSDALRELGA